MNVALPGAPPWLQSLAALLHSGAAWLGRRGMGQEKLVLNLGLEECRNQNITDLLGKLWDEAKASHLALCVTGLLLGRRERLSFSAQCQEQEMTLHCFPVVLLDPVALLLCWL